MWMSRWSRLLFALVICIGAIGCSSAAGQGARDASAQQSNGAAADDATQQQPNGTPGSPGGSPLQPSGGGGGAPGAPGNRGNHPEAVVAPVKIPAFNQDGQPISTAEPALEDDIKQNCKDGTLCLKVQVLPSDANWHTCGFDHLEHPKGTKIELGDGSKEAQPGDTVWMVCNPNTVDDSTEPSQDTTGSTESSQPQPTDTTTPPDSSQPQPTDTTTPPDSSQP